jgi:hypothetical protein
MPRVAPAARPDLAVEALAQLTRLQREMVRRALRNPNYNGNRRALHTAIRELRKMIASNVD